MAVGLIVSLLVAFVTAFFLYLRTAYRKGGWTEVKVSFVIAMIALVAFYLVRVAQNSELQLLKDAVNRMTR
jgi:Na+/proline symporter